LYVDNNYAINLARNSISHGRSNNIKTTLHFIKVNKGRIELSHYPIEKQGDDILTKALKHDRFKELRTKIRDMSLDYLN
jgi:hypothetical protein